MGTSRAGGPGRSLADLARLTDVTPPVRFGFASTPVVPSLVRVLTAIELGGPSIS